MIPEASSFKDPPNSGEKMVPLSSTIVVCSRQVKRKKWWRLRTPSAAIKWPTHKSNTKYLVVWFASQSPEGALHYIVWQVPVLHVGFFSLAVEGASEAPTLVCFKHYYCTARDGATDYYYCTTTVVHYSVACVVVGNNTLGFFLGDDKYTWNIFWGVYNIQEAFLKRESGK